MKSDRLFETREYRAQPDTAWIQRLMGHFLPGDRGSFKLNKRRLDRSESPEDELQLEPSIAELASEIPEHKLHEVAKDVAYLRVAMVNVIFVGLPSAGDRQWVLIDTGLTGLSSRVEKAARQRFGKNSRPAAIIITHAHFDHVGGLKELAQKWNVTIYAHPLEMPYLDGRLFYPALAAATRGETQSLSPLFQTCTLGVGAWSQPLPSDGSLPYMPRWKWIHTPGHSPGHVSLWRASDRLLIAGDAFITTHEESAYATGTQKPELQSPPLFFTPDWPTACESLTALALLQPDTVITGHGQAMQGAEMLTGLESLAADIVSMA